MHIVNDIATQNNISNVTSFVHTTSKKKPKKTSLLTCSKLSKLFNVVTCSIIYLSLLLLFIVTTCRQQTTRSMFTNKVHKLPQFNCFCCTDMV